MPGAAIAGIPKASILGCFSVFAFCTSCSPVTRIFGFEALGSADTTGGWDIGCRLGVEVEDMGGVKEDMGRLLGSRVGRPRRWGWTVLVMSGWAGAEDGVGEGDVKSRRLVEVLFGFEG